LNRSCRSNAQVLINAFIAQVVLDELITQFLRVTVERANMRDSSIGTLRSSRKHLARGVFNATAVTLATATIRIRKSFLVPRSTSRAPSRRDSHLLFKNRGGEYKAKMISCLRDGRRLEEIDLSCRRNVFGSALGGLGSSAIARARERVPRGD
jgi:hypothetical protein